MLAKAKAHLAEGQATEALAALGRVDPELADIARALAIQAHVIAGDIPAARKALQDLTVPAATCGEELADPLRDAPRRAVFNVLVETEPTEAARLAEQLAPDPSLLAAIGLALTRSKNPKSGVRWLERLLVEYPESPEAKALAEREPARIKGLNSSQRLTRMRALLEAHANEAAAEEAERWLQNKTDPQCEVRYIAGKAYRKMRRYDPALQHLEKARAVCVKERTMDFALRAALLEAQIRVIRGDSTRTRALAEWIEKQAPNHSYVDDAWFLTAEIVERRKGSAAARPIYERVIQRYPKEDRTPDAAWRLAFDDLSSGRTKDALARLGQIVTHTHTRSMDQARARYWQARLDPKDEAEGLAQQVWPPSFYGWLSLDRLRKHHPQTFRKVADRLEKLRSVPRTETAIPQTWSNAPELERAARLTRADLPEFAAAELARLECRSRTPDEILALTAAYAAAGAEPRAQRLIRRNTSRIPEDPNAPLHRWRLAYSRPFDDAIDKAARAAKVEPLLLTALAREESTFDPEIISWAGAIGLTQLMPATAIGAYADVFGGRLDLSRLVDPELNLRLGAHVLRQGLRSFGHPPLAMSAYNAGPGLTRRFLPAKATPFEIWVEEISVEETRRYVKRVSETWGIYQFLYSSESPFIDLPDRIEPK